MNQILKFLFLILLTGCSATTTTTTQPSEMSRAQLEEGMSRSDVMAKIGPPTSTSTKGEIRIDTYKQSSTNYAHGAACTAAGLATMGLGFIFCDGVSKKSVLVLTYKDDKLATVRTSKN
jgi:outer membrane protein assembly factor BamE (lipoprotein component of BamABCDE complex)